MPNTIQTAGSARIDGVFGCTRDSHVFAVAGEEDNPAVGQQCRCGEQRWTPPTAPSAEAQALLARLIAEAADEDSILKFDLASNALADYIASLESRLASHPDDRSDREREIGPGAWLRRCCAKFDRLLSLDHKPAREASEEYDEAYHVAVHALRDLRRFADTIAPTWAAARLAFPGEDHE